MAGTMPHYLRDAVAQHIAKLATYTPPTTVYAALCTGAPTAAAAGSELSSGTNHTGYARVALTLASLFSDSDGVLTTILDILWPQNTGASAWDSCGWIEFYDASSGGNRCLQWIVLGVAVACPVNEQVKCAAGAATETLT